MDKNYTFFWDFMLFIHFTFQTEIFSGPNLALYSHIFTIQITQIQIIKQPLFGKLQQKALAFI
jgi:hypothetical protein